MAPPGSNQIGMAAAGGRAGHAANRLVKPEEPLARNPRRTPQFRRREQPFLGLNRLLQPVAPRPLGEDAAGELIDEQHAAVLHDVIDVPLVKILRGQGLHDVFGPRPIERKAPRRMNSTAVAVFVNGVLAGLGQRDRAGPRIDHEVVAFIERGRHLLGLAIGFLAPGRFAARPQSSFAICRTSLGPRTCPAVAQDQRQTGLIDQHGIDLVDDGAAPSRLDGRRLAGRPAAKQFELGLSQAGPPRRQRGELVSQVIEAQFIAGSVRHVAGVGRTLGIGVRLGSWELGAGSQTDSQRSAGLAPCSPLPAPSLHTRARAPRSCRGVAGSVRPARNRAGPNRRSA